MAGQVYGSDELETWETYFARLDRAGPYHEPQYLATLEGNFEPPERVQLFLYDPDDVDGFVYYPYFERPLSALSFADRTDLSLEGYSDVVSSWYYGGPILSPAGDSDVATRFIEAFSRHCREENIVAEFIRFDPTIENHRDFQALEPTFDRKTVPVDLAGSQDDIWNGYEDRNRRAIRQAKEHDLVVEPTRDAADLDAFHNIYTNAMEAKGADPHYRFDQSFVEELVVGERARATLLVARYDGDVVGGFIAVHDDRIAHHYLSASIPDYWDMRVNNFLYHEVVRHFQREGLDTFDFQGGRPGVFKFKKAFSPDRGEYYVASRTHVPEVYDRLVSAASSDGIDTDTDYFPAYRVEQSN